MATIFAAAKEAELPAEAAEIEQEKLRQLVALCRELQRAAGDGPFFLSCRTAGRLLGVHFKTANRWLFYLVQEGLLELVKAGDASTMQASRYRYVMPL